MDYPATPLGVFAGAHNLLRTLAPVLVPAEIPGHVEQAIELTRNFNSAAKALYQTVKDDPKYAEAAERLNAAGLACDNMKIDVPDSVIRDLLKDALSS